MNLNERFDKDSQFRVAMMERAMQIAVYAEMTLGKKIQTVAFADTVRSFFRFVSHESVFDGTFTPAPEITVEELVKITDFHAAAEVLAANWSAD